MAGSADRPTPRHHPVQRWVKPAFTPGAWPMRFRKAAGQPPAGEHSRLSHKELGKAVPYGAYDIGANTGWVAVGQDGDTAAFAVEPIRRWWHTVGRRAYPEATELLITAATGGSSGYRVRPWKAEQARLANRTGVAITVTHMPPVSSKWNKSSTGAPKITAVRSTSNLRAVAPRSHSSHYRLRSRWISSLRGVGPGLGLGYG